MTIYKQEFVKFIFDKQIIRFGEYTLKSGRLSPYFFNFGSFNDASKLAALGDFYASAIVDKEIQFDVLFGPAYKGIPISLATSMALFYKKGINVEFAFNRKEKKDHGEGGNLVGSSIRGKRVLAVDDVITSGKTIKETKEIVESEGGILTSFLVALDREEKALDSQFSALEEAARTYKVNIYAVAGITDVMNHIEKEFGESHPHFSSIRDYLVLHGSKK